MVILVMVAASVAYPSSFTLSIHQLQTGMQPSSVTYRYLGTCCHGQPYQTEKIHTCKIVYEFAPFPTN